MYRKAFKYVTQGIVMEFKIIGRKNFPLLNRERVNIEVVFPNKATPRKDEIKREVAKLLNTDEGLLAIRHIYTRFGQNNAKVICNIYNNAEELKRFEDKKQKKVKKAAGAE